MSAAYDSVPYEVASALLAPTSSGELVIDLELDVEPDEEVFEARRAGKEAATTVKTPPRENPMTNVRACSCSGVLPSSIPNLPQNHRSA